MSDPALDPAAVSLTGNTLTPGIAGITTLPGLPSGGMNNGGYGDANYEVFDPLNWMLDGLVDFPYSSMAMQGLDQIAG